MKRENFYRRDPGLALAGMATMSLEERGVYNTVLDLLYLTWRPLEDNPAYIAGHCMCAVQKLNPIIRRLVEKGKLIRFTEGGQSYISNPAFEAEREAVKGPAKTRSGRRETAAPTAQVEEKSAGVEEKSPGVEENPTLLGNVIEENQGVTALDKTRLDNNPPTPLQGEDEVSGRGGRRKPSRPIPDDFPDVADVAAMQDRARQAGVNLDVARQAEFFRNHAAQNDRRCADWSAAWRNWVVKAIDRAPKTALATAQQRQTPGSDERWERLIREFRRNGYWPAEDAGPEPGKPGCRAPSHLLITEAAGVGPSPRSAA